MTEKAIGIRVSPKEVFYTIIVKKNGKIEISSQKLIVPKAIDFPRQLSYIRTMLYSLICEYDVTKAGLRTAEGSAQHPSVERFNIEGVIQELFSNSTVESYFAGTSTSIAARLKTKNSDITKCYKGKSNIFNVDGWEKLNNQFRESYLAALAALYN